MHTIKLYRVQGQGWVAVHSDPELKVLFGTDTLPLGFTDKAEPSYILAQITKLNPDRVVTLNTTQS